jgi:hypothetical protein
MHRGENMIREAINEAINVAPNVSAVPSPIRSKEDTMGSTTVAISAVAGSSVSTLPTPAPGKEVPAGSGGPSGPGQAAAPKSMLHDPSNSLRLAAASLNRARGESHGAVVTTSTRVQHGVKALKDATKELRIRERAEEDAARVRRIAVVDVEDTLAAARRQLRKRIHGGGEFYDACDKHDAFKTSVELLHRVALEKVPLEAKVLAGLQRAVDQVATPDQALNAAKERTRAAQVTFVSARRTLEATVPLLNASMLQARLEARAAQLQAKQAASPGKRGRKGG